MGLMLLSFSGCVQDAFAPETVLTPEDVTPSLLRYPTLINAREGAQIQSGVPTVQTGGVVPVDFAILGGRDQDGNEFTSATLAYITIEDPTYSYVEIENTGDIVILPNYATAGQITIATGHPFVFANASDEANTFYVDVRVTTELDGVQYSTDFIGGYEFSIMPNMPDATHISYLPLAQNLLTTQSGDKTTAANISQYGDNIEFSLPEAEEAIFDINATTGELSIDPSYVYSGGTAGTYYTPSLILTNTRSGEEKTITGSSSILTVCISSSPIDMPKATKYIFAPQFNTADGNYITVATIAGDIKGYWSTTTQYTPSGFAYELYPSEIDGSLSTRAINMVESSGVAALHDSWLILKAQNLKQYTDDFTMTAVFFLSNAYVEYNLDGSSPTSFTPYFSTDYGNFASATQTIDLSQWCDLTSSDYSDMIRYTRVDANAYLCDVNSIDVLPYPGDNKAVTDDVAADLKNTALKYEYSTWLRCEIDLSKVSDSENFTLAFRAQRTTSDNLATATRAGSFYIGGVYYAATEKAVE